jgi:hypothetical protein
MKANKKLKDYPPNVPRRLFKLLKECEFNRSLLAVKIDVNAGYISKLLNKGEEPPDSTPTGRSVRKKLFLKVYKQNRRKIYRTKQIQPEWMKKWNHYSKEERDEVKQTYVQWKEKNNGKNN